MTTKALNKFYQLGFVAGFECLSLIAFPQYPAEIREYIRGFFDGTYVRVHENSGDCENS